MDFKVSYLDAGLPSNYFSDSDQILNNSTTQHSLPSTPSRVNRRYKTQLRDFLSTCRTKRKIPHNTSSGQITPPVNSSASSSVINSITSVEYIATDNCPPAYNIYTSPYSATATDHGISTYMGHSNFQHGLYPSPATIDNRYLTTSDNLFHQYRPLSTYYTDYHHSPSTSAYVSNGFLDMQPRATVPTYDTSVASANHHTAYRVDDKIYSCQQIIESSSTPKFPSYAEASRSYVVAANTSKCLDVSWPYSVSPSSGIIQPVQVTNSIVEKCNKNSKHAIDISSNHSSPSLNSELLTPKLEEVKTDVAIIPAETSSSQLYTLSQQNTVSSQHYPSITSTTEQVIPRQTVLMWGSNHINHNSSTNSNNSPVSNSEYRSVESENCESLSEISSSEICKWNGENAKIENGTPNGNPESPHQHHTTHHNHHSTRVVMVL